MHSPDRQALPGADLLRLARDSIEHGLIHGEPLTVDVNGLHQALTEPAATFTTLLSTGKLRGCCGTLKAEHPLATDVSRSAFSAAFRDPRFDPLSEDEIAVVRLDISVLSPLEPMTATDETDLLDQLIPGTDGLVIVDGLRRATFLPKVWESLPDPNRFLAQLKIKCGLPGDYWSEQLEFQRYRTTSYAESD